MIIEPKEIVLKNQTKLILRSVKPEEAAGMLEHLVLTHGQSYQNLNRTVDFWKTLPIAEEEKILTVMEKSPKKFMLGAFDGHKIVGGLGIFGNDDRIFTNRTALLGMSIQEKFQGLGLGFHMITYALSEVRRTEIHRIELSVRTYNEAGIKLYEKMGFQRIGTLNECAHIDGAYVSEYLYEMILR